MDDYWNTSEITSHTLDNFFDEESDINWQGSSKQEFAVNKVAEPDSNDVPSTNKDQRPIHKTSSSIGSLSSILDNISIHSDSVIGGISSSKARIVGKSIGEKIESWKGPSVSIKWKGDGSDSCFQCVGKDEEIRQLKSKLEGVYSRSQVTLSPDDTVNRMILGQPYSLENYRMLDEKRSLLNCALKTLDSSSVLAILIFMNNTMRKNLFLKELAKYPLAAQIYVTYLKRRHENVEALDILKMLGRTEEAAMLKYELAISSSEESQVKHMQNALKTHFEDSSLTFEAKMVKNHINLLESQFSIEQKDRTDKTNPVLMEHPRASSIIGQSLLTTVYYCSMYHWNSQAGHVDSPLLMKKNFCIGDKQFLWTVLKARTKIKHWPLPVELEQLLATRGLIGTLSNISGWSGAGKHVKNALPIEQVVEFLATSGAPPNILFQYINLLSSNEKMLNLGLAYECHQAVVEAYIGLKDADSLKKYIKKMSFGSPEYVKAEQALKGLK